MSEHGCVCRFSLGNVLRATTACTFSTSQLSKVVRPCGVFYMLTWTCASRHKGVHFFDMATFKNGPTMWCVLCILTWMCASRHNGVYFFDIATSKSGPTCWCVLYILTRKCASRHNGVNFLDIAISKRGPTLVCLYILTWKCASRHSGVHFLISHLASCLRTRRFSEPTFPPSGATNHWKNTRNRNFQCFTTFLPFRASASSFF